MESGEGGGGGEEEERRALGVLSLPEHVFSFIVSRKLLHLL